MLGRFFSRNGEYRHKHAARFATCFFACCGVAAWLGQPVAAQEQSSTALPAHVPMAPLVAPNPGQKVLVIAPAEEQHYVRLACQQLRMPVETLDGFDAKLRDYRGYHAVIVGSNQMDYFSKPETQAAAAFQPILDFVASGGHLMMFATYHGRNMEHMERFDIRAGSGGETGMKRVSIASDSLFAGNENLLPKEPAPEFIGRFVIKRPHVLLFERIDGDPGAGTAAFGDGRVTICMVEPMYKKDFWLFRVLLAWHARGAPTRLTSSGMLGTGMAQKGTRLPVLTDDDLTKRREALQTEYEADFRRLKPWNAPLAKELARKILESATTGTDTSANYAALVEARELAAKSGDSATVLNAVEVCGRNYQIDVFDVLLESLKQSSSAVKSAADSRSTAEAAMMAIREAISIQRFDITEDFLELATGNAKRSRVTDLPKQVTALKQAVSDARKQTGK